MGSMNNGSSMTKQDHFLWMVQTAILANGISLANGEAQAHYSHSYSACGALIVAREAVRASERIPETMSAYDAALEFCTYMLDNLRHAAEDARRGKRLDLPAWFSRPDGQ